MKITAKYPLLFGYRDLVEGDGFVASVEIRGRGLLVEESGGEVWLYGVNPGGMAGGGLTRNEALSDFRTGYTSVLFDIAGDVSSFQQFEAEVQSFFDQTNEGWEHEWQQAVDRVRSGEVDADWLPKVAVSEKTLYVRVERLERPQAKDNTLDATEIAA